MGYEWIKEMPKAELHCHLDGSMGIATTKKLLDDVGECYEKSELSHRLTAPMDCKSLAEYLERFELPIRALQSKEALELAAYELAVESHKEGVTYQEVRFAPFFHTAGGLTMEEIIAAVIRGQKQAKADVGIDAGVIVCAMRHLSMQDNLAMLASALPFVGKGVVGCDLAGDEKAFATENFAEFFATAREKKVPFTIHAGECGSVESVRTAIAFGAKRIGHGIAMAKDEKLLKLCAAKGIGVELCPTSNLQTKAVGAMEEYPFGIFQSFDVLLSINTDNRTVSATTMTGELTLLAEYYNLTERDLERIYQDTLSMRLL